MKSIRTLAVCGWLALLTSVQTTPAQQKPTSKGIDPATVAAYEKLGGVYGGWAEFRYGFYFLRGQPTAESVLPGLSFDGDPKGKLPEVSVPFGLDFGPPPTNAGLKQLAGLKNLEILYLRSGAPQSDARMKEIASLKDLKTLYLSSSSVTDKGVKELAALKNLTRLFLHVGVTDAGLSALLVDLQNLETLSLWSPKVTDAGLKEVGRLKNLSVLDLHGSNKVTDAGLKHLAGLTSLKVLWLNSSKITNEGLKEIASLKSLATLILLNSKVHGTGLKELAGLKNLSTLQVMGEHLSDAALQALRQIGLLHALHRATGKDKTRPHSAEQVFALDLADTQVSDDGLSAAQVTDAALISLRQMQSLHVLGQASGKDGTRPQSQAEIAVLNLAGTRVTDAGLKELREAGLKSLSSLSLHGTEVTDVGLVELSSMKHLTSLTLARTKVTEAGLKQLRQALPNCQIRDQD